MTELSFLIDLLLNHKLQKGTKDLIAARIKDLGETTPLAAAPRAVSLPPGLSTQSPSTLAALAKHPDLVAKMTGSEKPVSFSPPASAPEPPPVTQIAQTPQTAMAMASRQEALSGKMDKTTGRPRKF